MFSGIGSYQHCWERMGSRIWTEKPALERWELSSGGGWGAGGHRASHGKGSGYFDWMLSTLHLWKKWGMDCDLEEVSVSGGVTTMKT